MWIYKANFNHLVLAKTLIHQTLGRLRDLTLPIWEKRPKLAVFDKLECLNEYLDSLQ